MRALKAQTTVRALSGQDVATQAHPRSHGTSGGTVYHVRGTGDGDSPTSLTKDTRGPQRAGHDPHPSPLPGQGEGNVGKLPGPVFPLLGRGEDVITVRY